MGYRLDELRAAVLRVQLRKLPAIIAAMRRSKQRIRASLSRYESVQLRRVIDPEGDTGCFLIATYRDSETAAAVNAAFLSDGIRAFPQGVSNVLLTEWGLHLYYNNLSLVHRAGMERGGFPWTLRANAASRYSYDKGTCPAADSLFARSVLLPIPSCLTGRDEDDIIRAFEKALSGVL